MQVDRVAIGQQGGAFDQIAQFADVAGVTPAGEPVQRLGTQPAAGLAVNALEQRGGEQRDVAGAFMERRGADGKGVDAEIEVATETFVPEHGLQVAVRRGDQAKVGRQPVEAADPAVGAGFEQAQQLDLLRKG